QNTMMKKMTSHTQHSATSAIAAYGDLPCPVEELAIAETTLGELRDADLRAVVGGLRSKRRGPK
ncbi:hypothetical protein DP117_16460, partial [Brasilonema sp. UFV-L1]|nr:hypothetical protein [Brasilonema sp. UFV-L1]